MMPLGVMNPALYYHFFLTHLCAITSTVRSSPSRSSASCTLFSVIVSRALFMDGDDVEAPGSVR